MIEVEKNRIQTEVIAKMEDFKKLHNQTSHENERGGFLSKFLKPFDLLNPKESDRKTKILYCEDCKTLSKLIQRLLESKGFDVTVSETPIHFLSKERLKQFDFVITDNNMPYMTGTQFTEYVEKELHLDIPMYLFTGDSHLRQELPITKVRRGIFDKGYGFASALQSILSDFQIYNQELKEKFEMKLAITANTMIC